jgi:hypothetical protein
MVDPTRYPNGVTNTKNKATSDMSVLDYTEVHQYLNDFDTYVAGDWTITEVGTGSRALTDEDGGVLLITNGSNDDDSNFFNKVGESYKFVAGKKLFFKSKFKVSDAVQSDFVTGLQITDTTPLDVTDGVFFRKDDGDANVDFVVEKDNTATTATAITTVSNNTYIELGFYYNGVDKIAYFVNGEKLGTSVVTNLPDDEELTISFGIQNGEAVAKTMSIDYILVVKER